MRDIRLENELKNCDFVRTALMLCIVIYHAMLFWSGDWFTYVQPVFDAKDTLGRLADWMKYWHNYAFVVLSGYLYYYLTFEDSRYDDSKKFIMNKVRRLLVPAYCIGVILVIPTAYYFHADVSVVWKYLIGVNSSHMWFLFMLFWVFTFAIKIGGGIRNNVLTVGVSIAFFVIGKCGDRYLPNLFQFWNGCMFFMYFVLGCKLRQGELDWVRRIPLVVLVILDICLFGVEQIFPQGKIAIGYLMALRLLVRVCLSVIGSLTAFLLLQYVAIKINWEQCRWFMFLKKYSYAIYLFHHPFIFFSIVWFNGIFNPYVHSLINFAVSMIISIVLAVVFSKSKVGRMMIGMK